MKALWIFLTLAPAVFAQDLILKDGKVLATKGLKRQGDTILATLDLSGGDPAQAAKTGVFGFPLAQIAKLDFPEPAQFRTMPDLIAQGHGAEALAQLEPIIKFYEPFGDAPGSWWARAALLKVQALVSMGREKEAAPITEQILHLAVDLETLRAARVQLAAGLVRKGSEAEALEICNSALKDSKDSRTLAAAFVVKGQCLLAKKQWEDAILTFLEVPVFYPGEKALLPQSLLGVGRAQFGMENFADARAALDQLIKTYAASSEAAQAKVELEKITRREKALAAPQ